MNNIIAMRNKIENRINDIVQNHQVQTDFDSLWDKVEPQLDKPKKIPIINLA